MGIRYRKSLNLGGGFRINISKSGIGYSWGAPGYRITHTASGKTRKTVSIPGTGISHVTESSSKNKTNAHIGKEIECIDITEVKSGDIENFKPVEFIDLTKKIQRIIRINQISTWLCLIFTILYIGHSSLWRLFLLIIFIGFKLLMRFAVHVKINYSFDDNSQQCVNAQKKTETWKVLKTSKQLWYISHTGKPASSRNAGGASSAYNRQPAKFNFILPYFLHSNIQLPVIRMKKESEVLIILPDCILFIQKGKVGAIKYENLTFDIYAIGEICEKAPTSDCKFAKNVWLYANKDGSPDKRHNDNRQLPVYEIGRIDISSKSGLDIRLAVSSTDILEKFKTEFESCQEGQNMPIAELKFTPPTPPITSLDRSVYGIAPEEINFLEYAAGHNSDTSTFSKKFFYEYGLNYNETISFLISNGYIITGNAAESLDLYPLQDLKNFLKEYGLPVSGTKPVLIQRIIESSKEYSNFFTQRKFVLTEKGKEVIGKYKADHNIPITEEEILNSKFRNYGELARTHLQEGNLGLYACDLYSMSEIYGKKQRYEDQLETLIMSAYVHLSGIDKIYDFNLAKSGHFKYAEPDPLLPPAVIRDTEKVMKVLNMNISTYQIVFKETITPALTPDHIFGIDKSLEIICLYLTGESKKAEEVIEQGTQEYISRYS